MSDLKDANDIAREHGAEYLRDMMARAEEFEPNNDYEGDHYIHATGGDAGVAGDALGLHFLSMPDLQGKPVPEREWAVANRIPARNVTLFSSEGGLGKTLVALHLAVAQVLGREWLGALPTPGPVIVVNAEDEADELHRRIADINAHYGTGFSDLGDLHLLALAGKDAVMGLADRNGIIRSTPLFDRLHAAACEIKPRLIVLDAAADVFAGDENDRFQVRQFIGMLRGLAMAADAAILLIGHPSLAGINSSSGLSGSTAWHNSVRARLFLHGIKPTGEMSESDLRVLEAKKSNYGPVSEKLTVRWNKGLLLPVGGTSPMDRQAAERTADQVFLALLGRFNSQNRNVSYQKGPNYAPKTFAAENDAKTAGVSKEALTASMLRLFDANRIHQHLYGKPSNPHSRLMVGSKT